MKYHINPSTGRASICRATKTCPFGEDAIHGESAQAARKAYEASMEADQAHLAAIHGRSEEAEDERLWQLVRERAKNDLTEAVNEEYARKTVAYMDKLKETRTVDWGRTRAAFIGEATVIKIALNDEGFLDSGREIAASEAYQRAPHEYIPMAHTKPKVTKDGVNYIVAEKVTPLTGAIADKSMPWWVDYVDCGQVGHTKEGVLVAYDL